MNALLDHVWGESPAVDRVWAQVTGMSPRLAVRSPIVVLQALIDDSYTPDGVFVLAGHIATAETWAKFSGEWEAMLPKGVLAPNGGYHFKMAEMAQTPDRMGRVEWFYRVIEPNDLIPICSMLNISDLRRATERVWSLDTAISRQILRNPFRMAYRMLMDHFHSSRALAADIIPPNEPVDFIFDEQSEKGDIIKYWSEYIDNRDENVRSLFGAVPRFENDRRFLPLQAADFWAWWMRKWYEDGKPESVKGKVFQRWRIHREGRKIILIEADEDRLTRNILGMFKSSLPRYSFYDSAAARPWP